MFPLPVWAIPFVAAALLLFTMAIMASWGSSLTSWVSETSISMIIERGLFVLMVILLALGNEPGFLPLAFGGLVIWFYFAKEVD